MSDQYQRQSYDSVGNITQEGSDRNYLAAFTSSIKHSIKGIRESLVSNATEDSEGIVECENRNNGQRQATEKSWHVVEKPKSIDIPSFPVAKLLKSLSPFSGSNKNNKSASDGSLTGISSFMNGSGGSKVFAANTTSNKSTGRSSDECKLGVDEVSEKCKATILKIEQEQERRRELEERNLMDCEEMQQKFQEWLLAQMIAQERQDELNEGAECAAMAAKHAALEDKLLIQQRLLSPTMTSVPVLDLTDVVRLFEIEEAARKQKIAERKAKRKEAWRKMKLEERGDRNSFATISEAEEEEFDDDNFSEVDSWLGSEDESADYQQQQQLMEEEEE